MLFLSAMWLGGCAGARPDATGAAPAATRANGDAHAGMNMGGDGDATAQEPIDYIPQAIGSHTWKITTRDAKAQSYFNQGMQLRWAYNMGEAARSMAEAHRLDRSGPCVSGVRPSRSAPTSTGGMTANNAPLAHAAIEKAVELVDGASAVERDLILAARVRYPADYDPENRRPVDEAFGHEMAKVYEKYPGDHEVEEETDTDGASDGDHRLLPGAERAMEGAGSGLAHRGATLA